MHMQSKAPPGAEQSSGSVLLLPVAAGFLAAVVGFASSFAIFLSGLTAVGASQAEAASGLFANSLGIGILCIALSLRWRMPVAIAWSTPGAALLAATGVPVGGYSAAVGAFLITAALVVVAGVWRPFGRAVGRIPVALAAAMLAGILLELCLAPLHAVGAMPALALPVVVAWAVALRFAPRYAVLIALGVAGIAMSASTPVAAVILAGSWPQPQWIAPVFTVEALIGIAVPLFVVTMASQNVPGLAVMAANGYRVKPGPVFVATGLGSIFVAAFGGQGVNLAAITAALCAGPEAHPDPGRRWIAAIACGCSYFVLALIAGFATAFFAASPPVLIQAVAGLALLSSLAGALAASLAAEETRMPAIVTFVTAASGISFFGIGAPFWALIGGGALMALTRRRASAARQ